jgi:biopolymer transport protein ExbD
VKVSWLKKLKVASLGSAMADMALLLLIFFMATTTSGPPEGGDVTLPGAAYSESALESISIAVTSKKEIYLNGQKTDVNTILSKIKKLKYRGNPIRIIADARLPYSEIEEILSLLAKEGFTDIVFLTETISRGSGER